MRIYCDGRKSDQRAQWKTERKSEISPNSPDKKMKTNSFLLKFILIQFLLITGSILSAQARKDFFVTLVPLIGIKDSFLLQCSVEEHTAQRNASSMFTTRLPSLPVKVGKWEEAIYVLSNRTFCMGIFRFERT